DRAGLPVFDSREHGDREAVGHGDGDLVRGGIDAPAEDAEHERDGGAPAGGPRRGRPQELARLRVGVLAGRSRTHGESPWIHSRRGPYRLDADRYCLGLRFLVVCCRDGAATATIRLRPYGPAT